jgi:threonine dehydrogenase-like Zn-dependent dehydrogenase
VWEEGELVLALPMGPHGIAEFIVSRPSAIARLPQDTPDPAALIIAQSLATVLRALSKTGGFMGQRCAVVGQGPMGLIFTHILRLMGASMIITTDLLDWRLEWCKRYGADQIIDASRNDIVKAVSELTGGKMIDFAVEAVGDMDSLKIAANLPGQGGKLQVFGVLCLALIYKSSLGTMSCAGRFKSIQVLAQSAVPFFKPQQIWSSVAGRLS